MTKDKGYDQAAALDFLHENVGCFKMINYIPLKRAVFNLKNFTCVKIKKNILMNFYCTRLYGHTTRRYLMSFLVICIYDQVKSHFEVCDCVISMSFPVIPIIFAVSLK